jgi:hypothetical protein
VARRDGAPAVPHENHEESEPESQSNVDAEQVHLVLTLVELDIMVDALRSVGNIEMAERFEALLRARHGGRSQA